jgi:hypothetical protein
MPTPTPMVTWQAAQASEASWELQLHRALVPPRDVGSTELQKLQTCGTLQPHGADRFASPRETGGVGRLCGIS